jgi:release factor glutamine methyltransferase
MSPAAPELWTTRSLLDWIASAFERAGHDAPRLSAELLLAHVLGCDRLRLYTEVDRPATPLERDALRTLVQRALKHEPVQYLVGESWFFSMRFHVDGRVLIPRPCTETMVEHVLQHARATAGLGSGGAFLIGDVCTGSGCIALSLLKNLPNARCVASDLSSDALEVAKLNAERHKLADRLTLLQGDLLTPLERHPAGQQLHYLVSNPPYIPDSEWNAPEMVGADVRAFEPEMALRGGPDGMRFVRPLVRHGPDRLRSGGQMLIEIAASTADAVLELAHANSMLTDVKILKDLEGHRRVLLATRR